MEVKSVSDFSNVFIKNEAVCCSQKKNKCNFSHSSVFYSVLYKCRLSLTLLHGDICQIIILLFQNGYNEEFLVSKF